jgi:competence protein ComEC
MSRRTKRREWPWAKYPAVRIAVLFAMGIALQSVWTPPWSWHWVMAVVLIGGWISFLWERRTPNIALSQINKGWYLLILVLGGAWYLQTRKEFATRDQPPMELFTWDEMGFHGTVDQVKHQNEDRAACLLDITTDSLVFRQDAIWTLPVRIRLRYEGHEENKGLHPGMMLGGQLKVYPLKSPTNPGLFDYRAYLRSEGIIAQGKLTHLNRYQASDSWISFQGLRTEVTAIIDSLYAPEQAALAKAIVMGEKSDLTQRTRSTFVRAGLAHIMAVSGLHVGILIGLFWILIPYIWTKSWGRWLGLAGVVTLCFLYAGLAGFPASVMRASIMGILLVAGKLFSKQRNMLNLLGFSALVILLVDPTQLTDVGFQLSFAALVMIVVVWSSIYQWIPGRIRGTWWMKWIGSVVLMSIVIQVGLLPFLIYYFDQISIVGPMLNVLALPLVSVFLPVALVIILLYPLWTSAAMLLNMVPAIGLWVIQTLAEWSVKWPGSWIALHGSQAQMLWIVIMAVLGVLLIGSWSYPRIRWKTAIALLMVGLIGVSQSIYQRLQPPELIITMLDVGQGDAIHIQTPSGKNLLIDAGRWSPGYNSGSFVIRPYLEALGIDHLDAVILSHPHADHIGGVPSLIEASTLSIGRIIQPSSTSESKLYERIISLAREKDIPIQTKTAGDTIAVDPQLLVTVLGPIQSKAQWSNLNESSLVLRMDYGQRSFLFEGDAERGSEQEMEAAYGGFLDTDLLKVGHHGSKTSSSAEFLNEVNPTWSLVSLGWKNRYHHPNRSSIRRLRTPQNHLFYTSRSGAIIIKSDGTRIWRDHWR